MPNYECAEPECSSARDSRKEEVMKRIVNDVELQAVHGGDICSWFGLTPRITWVEDGDWCFGIRVSV